MSGDFVWTHSDPRGLPKAIDDALEYAMSDGMWSGSGAPPAAQAEAVANFRAILVANAFCMTALSDPAKVRAPVSGPVTLFGMPLRYPTQEKADAAAILYRTIVQIVGPVDEAGAMAGFSTRGAGAPEREIGGGRVAGAFPILAVVAVVVVAAAGTIVTVYGAQKAAEIIDRQLARDQTSNDLMRAHGLVLKVLDDHTQREQQAGRELPLTDAERAALGILQKAQDDFAKRNTGPLPNPLPSAPDTTAMGTGLLLAVAAVAAFLLLKK